jgi:hypothetical protein
MSTPFFLVLPVGLSNDGAIVAETMQQTWPPQAKIGFWTSSLGSNPENAFPVYVKLSSGAE